MSTFPRCICRLLTYDPLCPRHSLLARPSHEKPRIKRLVFDAPGWGCFGSRTSGTGRTPAEAYEQWVRNERSRRAILGLMRPPMERTEWQPGPRYER